MKSNQSRMPQRFSQSFCALAIGFILLCGAAKSLAQNAQTDLPHLNKYFNRDLSDQLFTKLKRLNDELEAQRTTATRDLDRDRDIWVVRADGDSDPSPLTLDSEWDDDMPDWSPDDEFIAYISSRSNAKKIWLMKNDGTEKRQLTKGAANDYSPLWSPKGKQIAFIRNDRLYTIEVKSRVEKQMLAQNKVEKLCAWSRDGERILVVIKDSAQSEKLVEVDLATDQIVEVPAQPSSHSLWNNLRLSSAKDQVVFEIFKYDNYEITLSDLSTDKRFQITNNFSHDRYPAWSSKGDRIAFSSNRKTPKLEDLNW